MRKTIVLFLWLTATVGLTYVTNAAVELVDRQVLPEGSKIEVLSFPEEQASPPPTTLLETINESIQVDEKNISNTEVMETIPPETTTPEPDPELKITSTTTLNTQIDSEIFPESELKETATPDESESEIIEFPDNEADKTQIEDSVLIQEVVIEEEVVEPIVIPIASTTTKPVDPIVIRSQVTPKATMGEPYNFQLLAEGGKPPYKWSLSSGILPSSLKLSENGLISGVLEDYDSNTFELLVSDSIGESLNTAEFTIEIEKSRRTVVARGGTAFIDIDGDLVSLFLVSPADGYSAVIVDPGGFRVEVQFVPIQGDATSFVACEVNNELVCVSD